MFKPVNRYIQLDLTNQDENKTESGILLPDEYKPAEDSYVTATVINFSEDVKYADKLEKGSVVVVDKKMIEAIKFADKSINVVLENYILGIIN